MIGSKTNNINANSRCYIHIMIVFDIWEFEVQNRNLNLVECLNLEIN
jgi:hypothetical protein